MKTNKEGKEYFVEKIEEMMKRLSFEQVKLIYNVHFSSHFLF